MPGHNPRSRQDRYKRVQFYISQLGAVASGQLKQALLQLRNAADQLPTADLKAAASKQFTEAEFLPATKELMCIWIHLEAVDQGGEVMPAWLMSYLKLALYATDFLIPEPQATAIMDSHVACEDLASLYTQVSATIARHLGFGVHADALAPALTPLLQNSRIVRQKLLKESLLSDVEN